MVSPWVLDGIYTPLRPSSELPDGSRMLHPAVSWAGCVLQELVGRGIPAFAMQSGLSKDDFVWFSDNFHKLVCDHCSSCSAVSHKDARLVCCCGMTVLASHVHGLHWPHHDMSSAMQYHGCQHAWHSCCVHQPGLACISLVGKSVCHIHSKMFEM